MVILPIRRIEVEALRKAGLGDYIKHSFSRRKKYYVIENKKALQFLNDFRNSIKKNKL